MKQQLLPTTARTLGKAFLRLLFELSKRLSIKG